MEQRKFKRTAGRKWMKIRNRVLAEHPVCHVCKRRPSTQVDHVKPVCKGGGDESDNLQGICDECHDAKTRKDLGIKKKAVRIGLDGYPIKEEENNGQTWTNAEGKKTQDYVREASD